MRFLGIDLAWQEGNGSAVALLGGQRFPLHLRAAPLVLRRHREVLAWIDAQARHHRAVVGIDAPLAGLGRRGGRRGCDDAVTRAFGRFGASTHTPSQVPALRAIARALVAAYGRAAFGATARPRAGRPALREVYPYALQVRLFSVDRRRPARLRPYKRRRFRNKAEWVRRGLGPFVRRCRRALEGRYVARQDGLWQALVREQPRARMPAAALKRIEDCWDAVLCAVAVALEFLDRGSMRLYAGPGQSPEAGGAILAPVVLTRPGGRAPSPKGRAAPPAEQVPASRQAPRFVKIAR